MYSHFPTPVRTVVGYMKEQRHPSLRQRLSGFGDIGNGVSRGLKISAAESNPDMGLLTQQRFYFSPDIMQHNTALLPSVSTFAL